MNIIQTLGTANESYIDRPTVKAVIWNNDKVLLLNDGLLPGGGIDEGESIGNALAREIQEELGASIKNVIPLGTVVQYRKFLQKRYIVHGFTCELVNFNLETNPQDEGEKKFQLQWLDLNTAIEITNESIATYENKENNDDSVQGKLFNLLTTRAFLTEQL